MLNVETARSELKAKSMIDIEKATALTWGARAAASYDLCLEERDSWAAVQRFYEAENYRQEALEHAAMVENDAFLDGVRSEVEDHRIKARKALTPRSAETSQTGSRSN